MTMQNEDYKPSLEELMHSGVKGMKWGHRKAKPTTADIKGARKRVKVQSQRLSAAEDKMTNPNTGRINASAHKKFKQLEMDFLKNPDRATALRLTTGEKFIFAAFGPAGAGAAIGQVAVRKMTEANIKKHNP